MDRYHHQPHNLFTSDWKFKDVIVSQDAQDSLNVVIGVNITNHREVKFFLEVPNLRCRKTGAPLCIGPDQDEA